MAFASQFITGIIWVFVAMNMDVSISTRKNIGLMAQQSNQTMIGSFVAFSGLLMVIFGGRRPPLTPLYQSGDLRTCPFCAEPIKRAAINCKHCGSDLAHEQATTSSVWFGWVAMVSCKDQKERDEATSLILHAGLPVIDMLGWDIAGGAYEKEKEARSSLKLLTENFGLTC
ncbi:MULTISPECIES: zinc ribbon domain-containing protein [Pseudomonas]|uniref:Zinc ribbon domain-containing protein n=1 Tax=Pseudomonas quercus TaxID=2722792 RepID=A0ABX0YCH2_9PSED|nr:MULTISPECIES: zinc ribbon domain-containing protein [Pseudomonas]MBF7141438.1 zinc ribbon domain-containing protein [Pseudomonas sp. LY10J]NJO99976.1 zinc ribbon domain-containing protein [Pseudomonas quercus]